MLLKSYASSIESRDSHQNLLYIDIYLASSPGQGVFAAFLVKKMASTSFNLKAYKDVLESNRQLFREQIESESSIISDVRQRRTVIESKTDERKARLRETIIGQRRVS